MLSYTQLVSQFQTLSLNSSTSNSTLAGILINQQYRSLLLNFFDNERFFTLTTIRTPNACPYHIDLGRGFHIGYVDRFMALYFLSSICGIRRWRTKNRIFHPRLHGDHVAIGDKYYPDNGQYLLCRRPDSYPLPANVSKIKNSTITVGQLVYTPAPVQTIQEWTRLNALPYTSEIPAYFFVYGGELNFWPIPSATGDVMTLTPK